jgi:phosphoribosylformylglycinamidine synthase
MKFGVVTFPGSNCDQDLNCVLSKISGGKVISLWHKDSDLQGCDFIFLPGGFSYGDYLRSGAIAKFSPIMKEVILHAQKGGYVMGICNGFQILTECGLLPGALLRNRDTLFICSDVFIRATNTDTLITRFETPQTPLMIPIAHGEGNYYCDEESRKKLWDNNQVLFRYCNSKGEYTLDANLNGSLDNIAGICNTQKNVFGMMPHPERASDARTGNTDGLKLFNSILQNLPV